MKTTKTYEEILANPKDHRAEILKCGCKTLAIGRNKIITPLKCSKHQAALNQRNSKRFETWSKTATPEHPEKQRVPPVKIAM